MKNRLDSTFTGTPVGQRVRLSRDKCRCTTVSYPMRACRLTRGLCKLEQAARYQR